MTRRIYIRESIHRKRGGNVEKVKKGLNPVFIIVLVMSFVGTGMLGFSERKEVYAESEKVIFFDDFESYGAGTYPSAHWTMMYNGISAEISSEQYYSSSKSFKLCALSNWCRTDYIQIGYMDRFYYEARLYAVDKTVGIGFMIPRGGYNPSFNIVRFNNDGNIYFRGQLIQPFSRNKWYSVRVYIDYTTLTADLYIDGVKKAENVEIDPYSFYDSRWGDVVLDKFCLNVPNFDLGSGTAYFDDVLIVELSSKVSDPDTDTDTDTSTVTDTDIDTDGVLDSQDRCYNPGCPIVDSQGCPQDSDSDGVDDCDDGCPSEYGTSDNGCPSIPFGVFSDLSPFFYIFLIVMAFVIIMIVSRKRKKRTVYDETRAYDDDTRIY